MPDAIRFFDEAARVGEMILVTLGSQSSSGKVAAYFERAAEIYRLMAQVHDKVAGVTVLVSLARNDSEAQDALSQLDRDRLTDVFRARHWCDEFERLGRELMPLAGELGLADADRAVWGDLCGSLIQREGEVARLYEEKLYELRRLLGSATTLESLKETVTALSEQLVMQKAKFDLLAMKAEAMRQRMH
jgi:hypothetical protein